MHQSYDFIEQGRGLPRKMNTLVDSAHTPGPNLAFGEGSTPGPDLAFGRDLLHIAPAPIGAGHLAATPQDARHTAGTPHDAPHTGATAGHTEPSVSAQNSAGHSPITPHGVANIPAPHGS